MKGTPGDWGLGRQVEHEIASYHPLPSSPTANIADESRYGGARRSVAGAVEDLPSLRVDTQKQPVQVRNARVPIDDHPMLRPLRAPSRDRERAREMPVLRAR